MLPTFKLLATAIGLIGLLILAGCRQEEPVTPTACREGTEAFLTALAAAPGDVRLADGETRISDCLVRAQEAGPLAETGQAMVGAATELNTDARLDPGGSDNLRLGFLLGAAQRGAERTSGIHTDLIRRLEASATFNPDGSPLSAAFQAALDEGIAAGDERG